MKAIKALSGERYDGRWVLARVCPESWEALRLARLLPWDWRPAAEEGWVLIYLRAPDWWLRALLHGHGELFRWLEGEGLRRGTPRGGPGA